MASEVARMFFFHYSGLVDGLGHLCYCLGDCATCLSSMRYTVGLGPTWIQATQKLLLRSCMTHYLLPKDVSIRHQTA